LKYEKKAGYIFFVYDSGDLRSELFTICQSIDRNRRPWTHFSGAIVPFGMVQLSPDTRIDGSWDGCSGYHYSDSVIYGFSHTHLNGTGVSDYGDIMLMPTMGNPGLNLKIILPNFLIKTKKQRQDFMLLN
jgi:hypothetical protein